MNPELDIGQVEGAYMMGLGMWLTEKIIYDTETGRNLTNGTWVRGFTQSDSKFKKTIFPAFIHYYNKRMQVMGS